MNGPLFFDYVIRGFNDHTLFKISHQVDKAREEMEKKKADFKAGKSLTVSLFCMCVCL